MNDNVAVVTWTSTISHNNFLIYFATSKVTTLLGIDSILITKEDSLGNRKKKKKNIQ